MWFNHILLIPHQHRWVNLSSHLRNNILHNLSESKEISNQQKYLSNLGKELRISSPLTSQRELLNDIAQRLSIQHYGSTNVHQVDIKDFRDWYRVKVTEFKQEGGTGLLNRYGSMTRLLTSIYPEYLYTRRALTGLI